MPSKRSGLCPAALEEARLLAENIIATVREPLLVLDSELRIVSASRSFYMAFRVIPDQTERRLLYEVGNRQWDIPDLKPLSQDILPRQAGQPPRYPRYSETEQPTTGGSNQVTKDA